MADDEPRPGCADRADGWRRDQLEQVEAARLVRQTRRHASGGLADAVLGTRDAGRVAQDRLQHGITGEVAIP